MPLFFSRDVHKKVNDLPSVCAHCKVESCVDDSKLYVSFFNKDIDIAMENLKNDLTCIASWCCAN